MLDDQWQFWIDRGGTFTDCLGRDPRTGVLHTVKVLSSDRAPIIGIRRILGRVLDPMFDEPEREAHDNPEHQARPIPPCQVRMGTTVATNALLERHGAACALVVTRGFRDLLAIGNQTRAELFALDIQKPELLYAQVVEASGRMDPSGHELEPLDIAALEPALRTVRDHGIDSLAVVLLHAYKAPEHERRIGELAHALGFAHISLSHAVACEIGMVGRGDTTVVDAYLTPLLRAYIARLESELPGSSLRIMQSSGGLTDAARFSGRNAVLSGPAGGVVAYAHVARRAGFDRAIGFDMGGTSTDVSCYDRGFERVYETQVAGIRLRAPMMAIHTVAAGGGSLCRYRGFRLTVGPESAGAHPGPLCYGHPEARELALTDINVALGRVAGDRFPFPLHQSRVRRPLDDMARALGPEYTSERVAAGFFDIANANMAEAIRQVSIARGRDVRDFPLVVFGGAGGQHACAVARLLGVRTLIFDRFAGVLSAYGMGLADVSWHGEADAGRVPLSQISGLRARFQVLSRAGRAVLRAEGFAEDALRDTWRVDARYRGTDTPITLNLTDNLANVEALAAHFTERHRALFGYARIGHTIEAGTLRVEVCGANRAAHLRAASERQPSSITPKNPATSAPEALRTAPMWTDAGFQDVPVYLRESLTPGVCIHGPALILEHTNTIALDPGFVLEVENGDAGNAGNAGDNRLILRDRAPIIAPSADNDTRVDAVRLEIFNNAFMSIATQMGNALQRTAVSTNIRERLDFSCAVFDANGGLVANAPHIPVHLGAMGESVRGVLEAHPEPAPNTVFVTNDPNTGGSHLPDITVVTPVYDDDAVANGDNPSNIRLLFFTASRGHHADIGGITPGSMPPFSTRLDQEGAVFRALAVVSDRVFDEDAVRAVLLRGPYPARDPEANIADLQAQIAANNTGAHLLHELITRHGHDTVMAYMGHVQDNATARVAQEIERLPDGDYRFADALDDGTPVCVCVCIRGSTMHINFTGTGPQSRGNLNAPRAVTVAAVLYVLRTLVGAPIPLNSGCMRPVKLTIPRGSLLWPDPDRAVAGGNVETSQRIVDVLLGALGKAAASQGTMNNVTFGNQEFGYYETIAGGAGATANAPGASGVHTHMTNTRITDPEILESRFPVRLREFSLRTGSGGAGAHRGGDGIVREFEVLAPMRVSILSERRTRAPFGLNGGQPGARGRNLHNGSDVGNKASFDAARGDRIRIETPGGGGFGAPK